MLKGVKFFGWTNQIVLGGVLLLLGVVRLPINNPDLVSRYVEYGYNFKLLLCAYGQLLIMSPLYFYAGHGLINEKEGARKKTLNVAIVSLIINVIIIVVAQLNFNIMNNYFTERQILFKIRSLHFLGGIMYPIILLIYFNTNKVKKYFEQLQKNK